MPNKKVDDLVDETDRISGQEWQEALDIEDMTTREWNEAADMASSGKSDDDIREDLLENRDK